MTKKSSKAKILIVEDESVNAKLLESRVKIYGHIPIGPALTGEAAIELALREKPSLILMDIRLQGEMDGIEAARIIKEKIHTQIIYITAHSEEEFLERAKPTIPQGYILKPFQEKELKIAIDMALYIAKVETERRKAESALKEREALLNATGMMAKVGGWELDANTLEVIWTEQTHRIHEVPLDYKPPLEEAINFFHPDDRKKLSDAIKLALEQGEAYDMELRFITAKGNQLWTRTQCVPELVDGKVVKLKGTFQDITEIKEIEQDLRRSEHKYRLLADNANDVIFTLDMNLNYTYVSPSVYKMRGYLPEEILSGSISQSLTDESMRSAAQLLEKELEIESQVDSDPNRFSMIELEMKCKDGTTIWTEAKVSFLRDDDGNPVGIIGASRDISDRNKSEDQLKESEKKYRQLFNHAPAGIYDIDFVQNRITSVNDVACHVTGYSREEIFSMSPLDFLVGESKNDFIKRLEAHSLGEPVSDSLEYEIITKSGNPIWVLFSISFKHEKNQIVGASVVAHDITDKVRAEKALEESEEKYRTLFNQSTEGIYLHDLEGHIIDVNEMACKQSGYSRDELLKMTVFDFHPEPSDSKNLPKDAILRQWSQWKPGDRLAVEAEHLRKDGSVYPVNISTGVISYSGRNLMLAIVQDITERRLAEKAIKESEERFRGIFATSPVGIAIVDTETQQFLQANHSFLDIVGYTIEELEKLKVEDITSTDGIHSQGSPLCGHLI